MNISSSPCGVFRLCLGTIPALQTRMSTPPPAPCPGKTPPPTPSPKREGVQRSATNLLIDLISEKSTWSMWISWLPEHFFTFSPISGISLRHAMMTFAPRFAQSTAMANPSPELDPSTNTVFPSKRSVVFNVPAGTCFLKRSLIPVRVAETGLLYFLCLFSVIMFRNKVSVTFGMSVNFGRCQPKICHGILVHAMFKMPMFEFMALKPAGK